MATLFNEDNTIEQMVITTLKNNGWKYIPADALPRIYSDVLVEPMVKEALIRLNPEIAEEPSRADEVIYKLRTVILSVQPHNLVTQNEVFKKMIFEENSYPFGKNGRMIPIRFFGTMRKEDLALNEYVVTNQWVYLIKKFADLSKKNAGEFYTPRSIVKLLIMLLAPKAGETVYDPACGTGGMLIEAIRFMNDDKLTYGRIYGQEKNLATSAIARMNLFLHGAKDFKVTQGDTLRSPNYLERGSLQTFDCVVANPPFSLKNWGSEQFSSDIYGRNIWGCPTDSNGDFAWLQHMVKSMNPKTGRCAVVLPQGVLFRPGKEADIRRQLVESDKLEAIITMASGVFYSTGVSACILFLNNNKAVSHRGHICMIDGSGIYTPQRAQKIMTETDIQTVFNYFTAYEDVIEKVKVVTIADIREKDYSLAINNFIEKKEQDTVPPEEIRRQYFEAYDEMIEAETRMRELLLKGGYVSE